MRCYRMLDGSTVCPGGAVIYKDGTTAPVGTAKYPPDPEIGGLHPITLPDPVAAPTGLPFTVQATPPSSSGSFSGPPSPAAPATTPIFTARRVGLVAALVGATAFVGYEIWRHK